MNAVLGTTVDVESTGILLVVEMGIVSVLELGAAVGSEVLLDLLVGQNAGDESLDTVELVVMKNGRVQWKDSSKDVEESEVNHSQFRTKEEVIILGSEDLFKVLQPHWKDVVDKGSLLRLEVGAVDKLRVPLAEILDTSKQDISDHERVDIRWEKAILETNILDDGSTLDEVLAINVKSRDLTKKEPSLLETFGLDFGPVLSRMKLLFVLNTGELERKTDHLSTGTALEVSQNRFLTLGAVIASGGSTLHINEKSE